MKSMFMVVTLGGPLRPRMAIEQQLDGASRGLAAAASDAARVRRSVRA